MLFLNIMLSVFVSFADTVNVSKQHLLQEVTVVASRTMNKGNKIIVQMREDENKTMDEVLASVPHVAVTESGISIDGRGKVKVLLNGHEVRMEGAALISYLQSLRSSDISKVEIQTVADASQDANVQGGVINIVLRKQKDNGVNGSIENRLNVANTFFRNTAAVSVFSRWNKVNLYASFSNPITAKNNGEGRIKRVFNLPSYDYNSSSERLLFESRRICRFKYSLEYRSRVCAHAEPFEKNNQRPHIYADTRDKYARCIEYLHAKATKSFAFPPGRCII